MTLPDEPGIYIIKEDEKILYIGKSKSILKRCSQHIMTRRPHIDVEYDVIRDEDERDRRERQLISEYQPPLNVVVYRERTDDCTVRIDMEIPKEEFEEMKDFIDEIDGSYNNSKRYYGRRICDLACKWMKQQTLEHHFAGGEA